MRQPETNIVRTLGGGVGWIAPKDKEGEEPAVTGPAKLPSARLAMRWSAMGRGVKDRNQGVDGVRVPAVNRIGPTSSAASNE